jgi:choline-sulfatase
VRSSRKADNYQLEEDTMPQQPNILLIMADQLVPFLTGAYGHPVVQTPNLNRLAAGGICFDAAYTPYPLCAPARAAFMTGRYASSLGCFDNASVLHADQPTLAHYLTNAGYETVLSGKMHFIGPDQRHGFSRRLTTDVFPANIQWVPVSGDTGQGGHAHHYVLPNVGVRPWTKFLSYDEETEFRALEFIRERGCRRPTDPFFLVASFHHPHDPFHVTQELWDLYDGAPIALPDLPDNLAETYSEMDRWLNEVHGVDKVPLRDPDNLRALRRAYYGLVTYVDRKVGNLLAALDETGQRQNTIVIFTADHGDMLGEKGMVQKRCFYEWSARIPLIFHFPDGDGGGQRVKTPVSLLDLMPTFLDLAAVPEADRLPGDGRSLCPLLAGREEPERTVFSEYHVEKVKGPAFMVRHGRYKYIHIHEHDSQLFDLETDPGEWHNLAGRPEFQPVEEDLHGLILGRFDPEQLAQAGMESVRRRLIIREALQRSGERWDFSPTFDATKQYVR